MSNRTIDVLLDGDYSFFEGPRWHDGRLYVSDFYNYQVIAADLDGKVEKIAEVAAQPSGLGWLPDGRLLVVSMKDRRILRLEASGLVEHADLSDLAPCHLNDMIVDARGNAYVGNFGSDILHGAALTPTAIYLVRPDGSASAAAQGLHFPNGMAITPDGVLVVAETVGNRLSAFDVAEDGTLGERRDWVRFGDVPATDDLAEASGQLAYAPDGIVADAEGGVWFADAFGRRAVRVLDGSVVEEVSTAGLGLGTYSLTLGGPDGRTLFLCSAPSFAEEEAKANHAAKILTTTVDVPLVGH
jgi:sugar lactone lactonase YvrE